MHIRSVFAAFIALVTSCGGSTTGGAGASTARDSELEVPTAVLEVSPQLDGWTEFVPVESDGSFGDTDEGSRIAYIDSEAGDNGSGQYYWWNGSAIVDADGNEYGSDPFQPSGEIRAFASWGRDGGAEVRGGEEYTQPQFPDWILYRRGQDHRFPDSPVVRPFGRSPEEPGLIGAYGDLSERRPRLTDHFPLCYCGNPQRANMVFLSLHIDSREGSSLSFVPVPPERQYWDGDHEDLRAWLWVEDVYINGSRYGMALGPGIADVTIYRSIFMNVYDSGPHNQGVFVGDESIRLRVEESLFYRNGFKSDPTASDNPERDIFSRNFYLGGGENLGVRLRNVISADGGSGGPQVRYGGIVEDSLVIEGYWFTSTDSSGNVPSWLAQGTKTYEFRNNVQFVFRIPRPGQTINQGGEAAQPGWGFSIMAASSGVFENNIISGALLDEMGFVGEQDVTTTGITIEAGTNSVNGTTVYMGDNEIRDNILYRVSGLSLGGEEVAWQNGGNVTIHGNQWFDRGSGSLLVNTRSGAEASLSNNQLFSDREFSEAVGQTGELDVDANSNSLSPRAAADYPEPNRTLRTYATEVLGLEVTSDTGMPEFFEAASAMRKGNWNEAYTAKAVVNYVREGFGLEPID